MVLVYGHKEWRIDDALLYFAQSLTVKWKGAEYHLEEEDPKRPHIKTLVCFEALTTLQFWRGVPRCPILMLLIKV